MSIKAVEQIEVKSLPLTSKVVIERQDYDRLVTAAQKYVVQEKKESKLKKLLNEAKETIADLKNTIVDLTAQLTSVRAELANYKSVRGVIHIGQLEQENSNLRNELSWYEEIINRNSLRTYFSHHREKTYMRDKLNN